LRNRFRISPKNVTIIKEEVFTTKMGYVSCEKNQSVKNAKQENHARQYISEKINVL